MESNGESLLHPQKRRVKEETVLPDPRSHLWTLEPHHACLLGAEIREVTAATDALQNENRDRTK